MIQLKSLVKGSKMAIHLKDKTERQIDQLHWCVTQLHERLQFLEEGFIIMANDFSGLNAALDAVAAGLAEVAAAIANPAADNNDQATIDAITARLGGFADQLSAAKVAEDAEDGVVAPTA
jgi:hypothetical protein